ncbi:hypothetical protein EXN66_Car003890 [Channa argus]|uniref:Uncharacterized protein n=1 Tax=Channa argus TaxID=215402 RepID=A0A6G1PDX4_CHAAH|nr:hypothetical protein EXN66_Car003890 [Channa argus]
MIPNEQKRHMSHHCLDLYIGFIRFKALTLTYRVFNTTAPSYFNSLIQFYITLCVLHSAYNQNSSMVS